MTGRLLLRALLPTAPWALLAALVTALVIAPAFTVIGGLLTWLLLFTAYPLFLLVLYGGAGAGAAAWRRVEVAAAPLPRWRAALALGGGAALTLTLVLLATALALGVALGGWLAANGASVDPRDAFRAIFNMALAFTGAYLLGGLTLGTLCAWFGAWLVLRRLPDAAGVAEAPGAR